MKKLLLGFLVAGYQIAAFGQCSVQSSADVSIPCNGSTTITAPTTYTTYGVTTTSCSPVPIVGTNAFPTACDDCVTGQIPIGFTFNFFGTPYTTCVIQSNGIVGFGPFTFTGYSSFAIPSGGNPNNYIAGFFADIDIVYGGTITYAMTGVAPNRRFVVSYNNVVPFPGPPSATGTASFQIILNEDGSFNVVVSQLSANWYATTSGALATSGAENADGTYAIPVPGRNATDWPGITPVQNDCQLFNPSPCTFQNWKVGGSVVSTSGNYTVTPAATTTYTATWNCGGNICTDQTVVTVSTPPTAPAVSVCSGTNASLTCSSCGSGTTVNPSTTFNSGTLSSTDPTWTRPYSGTSCSMSGTTAYYDVYPFTVSTNGSYTFAGCMPAIDGYGFIYANSFNAAAPCGVPANFIVGDDDGNGASCSLDPLLTATLSTGVQYYLVTTSFGSMATDSYSWSFTGPGTIIGGSGTTLWYTAATGGTSIGSGSPFNPVGVAGSGITSNTQVGTYTFYAECTSSPGCRQPVTYTISSTSSPATSIAGTGTICNGSSATLSVVGGSLAAGAQWQWFSGSCGGTPVGTGSSISVTPSATTTYYVQASSGSGCPATACVNGTLTLPTAGTTLSNNNESATCVVNTNGFVHFYHSSGRLIASINSNGQNLGNVTATSYVNAPLDVNACIFPAYYVTTLGRHWVITPQFQPASPVTIALPYDQTEFTTLQGIANANSSPYDNVSVIGDLKCSKYSGPNNVDNIAANNCPAAGGNGGTVIYSPSGTGNVTTLLPGFSASARYSTYAIPGFSEFWLHGSTTLSPLPVSLTDFNVSCYQDHKAVISWSIENEYNCLNYVVERNTGGEWMPLTSVACTGQSFYTVTDENRAEGLAYYRLKQVDSDGENHYYAEVSLNCAAEGFSFSAYPNPASQEVTVKISSEVARGEAEMIIMDFSGKIVSRRPCAIPAGTSVFPVNTSGLASGAYFIQIKETGSELNPVKLIIQH